MNIQELMDKITKNQIREFHNIPHPICEPQTWQLIRWIAMELATQGVCQDNYKKLTEELTEETV